MNECRFTDKKPEQQSFPCSSAAAECLLCGLCSLPPSIRRREFSSFLSQRCERATVADGSGRKKN